MSDKKDKDMCEQTLLEGLRAGDPASQETLVRQYGPRVLATAKLYMGNADDAADVFQEAFIKILRSIGQFEGRSSLASWMHSITVRVSLTQLRKKSSRGEVALEAATLLQDKTSVQVPALSCRGTGSQVESDDVDHHVRTAVESLPNTYRTIIVLRDFLGASTKEAADTLGIDANAARVRLYRARRALRDILDARFDRQELMTWHPAGTPSTSTLSAAAA